MSSMNESLNSKQRQYIYDTIIGYKASYGRVGTVANAMLAMLCAIGADGIHIKSLEGMHIAAPRTVSNAFFRTLQYIRTINKVLKGEIGGKAPQLSMDMVGNQRVRWVLAGTKSAIDEAFDELNEPSNSIDPINTDDTDSSEEE